MKKVRDVMITQFPLGTGTMSVRSAISLMREHGIEALPVVDNGTLRGVVSYMELSAYHPNRLLFDVMLQSPATADPDMSLAAAYDLLDGNHAGCLPVIQEDKLVGIITQDAIQSHLGISSDPLTGLPWANALRERAIAHLMQGQEIIILFMDIDNFRMFNKEYGHVVGDRVITAVSQVIQKCIDPVRDFPCRYAGDEFAIVSVRTREEGEELAQQIQARIREIRVEGMGQPIGVSVGIQGGRRTKEREGTHYAATVDDLINLASQTMTKNKPHAPSQTKSMPVPTVSPVKSDSSVRPSIAGLKMRSTGTRVEVEVKLAHGDMVRTGVATGAANAQAIMRLVAEATLEAANLFLPEGYLMASEAVERYHLGEDKNLLVSVVALSGSEEPRTLAGAVIIQQDIYRSVIEATLHAINRFLTHPSVFSKP